MSKFKEQVAKIKEDKTMMAVVIGLFVILIYFSYQVISSFSKDDDQQIASNDTRESMLIPGDNGKPKKELKKSEVYHLDQGNNDNFIDGQADLINSFSTEEIDTTSPAADNLRNKYYDLMNEKPIQSNKPNVSKDFSYKKHNSNNSNNSTIIRKKEKKENEEPEVVQKKRKDLNGGFGNFGGNENGSYYNTKPIKGIIHNGSRKVKQGASVRVRLKEALKISKDVTLPEDLILTGVASFGSERVLIKFTKVNYNNNLYDIEYEVSELDGYVGIYDPNVIDYELAQSTINKAMSEGGSKVKIPIIGEVSLDIAKRKLNEQETIVPEGHHVLLKPIK